MGDWSNNLEYEHREYYGHFYDTDENVHEDEEEENKGDLISRQAVENITWEEPSYSDPLNVLTEVREKVRALPSVENKGEWIAQDIHNCHTNFKCSNCGYIHSFMHLYGEPTADYTYCPNCGAKMKGGEE